jgi:hypothetical protein
MAHKDVKAICAITNFVNTEECKDLINESGFIPAKYTILRKKHVIAIPIYREKQSVLSEFVGTRTRLNTDETD